MKRNSEEWQRFEIVALDDKMDDKNWSRTRKIGKEQEGSTWCRRP